MATTTLTAGQPPRLATARGGGPHPWRAFLLRRFGQFLLSAFILLTAVFALAHAMPGDPVRAALGSKAPPEVVTADRHRLGLDKSLWEQYGHYLHGLVTGNLGDSLITGLPVRTLMTRVMPATIELAVAAFVLAVLVAIPVGMLTGIATRDGRARPAHVAFAAVTGILSSIPEFLLAAGLVFVFAVSFKALPVAGRTDLSSYILPVISLAAGPAALLARIVRVETQRVLGEEYMRTARSKRLPGRLLYTRHALPNLLTAALTVSGLALSSLLAGTVLVETVFAWPGAGSQLVQSVLAKDFPVVQAMGLFFGCAVLLVNLAVDVVIAVVDPRSVIKES
ncbi:ABC transporter permease [Streptomyces sp. CA-111067]|uniref:ABC transporter permease n=1 Tax=Streptomyces sp. CA-111067 TaxID=3240046 RepID=UPI003D98D1E2